MVQFHERILTDLFDDPTGGLVIISSGLSLSKLISSLILLHHPSQGTLLLLQPPNISSLKSHLHHYLPDLSIHEITAELPHHQRLALYSSSNICFITSRILIVDLLTQRIPTSKIGGLVILNSHSLTDTSTEAFIARILKSFNRNVCIRAFSDKPHAMVSGFAKTERIMKSLYIRRLHLWPRFQVNVSEELEREPPMVVDVRVPMTKYMVGIQKAILEVMDACLKEMRKTNKIDVEDLTVENGLFKSFDEIVKRQLDPVWHTLGKKTKQLVSDLQTLRKLLDYLVRYDAVSFLKYLDTLRVSESFRSVWIFAESSYKIFDYAKKRVYRFTRSDGTKLNVPGKSVTGKKRKLKEDLAATSSATTSTNNGMLLEEVLEEAPKWKVLREILEEIEEERREQALSSKEVRAEAKNADGGFVLVACKDERSCMQLEDCIMNSSEKVSRDEWEKYLLSKVELRGKVEQHSVQRSQKKKSTPKGYGILDGVLPVTPTKNTETSSINKQEHEALLAAALGIRKQEQKDSLDGEVSKTNVASEALKKGIKKGNNKKSTCIALDSGRRSVRNKRTVISQDSRSTNAISNSKTIVLNPETERQEDVINPGVVDGHDEGFVESECLDRGLLWKDTVKSDSSELRSAKSLPLVHFYALEKDQPVLHIFKPSVIIVYHPDMSFVREIEIYKAENASLKLKVYFLFYEDSVEVQKFEASIRRENGAFESLIRQKSLMMIPVDQDGIYSGLNSSLEQRASSSQNSLTRKAGGRKEAEKEVQVIVDMREFMSSLPNVLHQKGMRIIPVTLEVGDYILSPLICVERKSIQDLFMSFTSGRLYNQVETMVRYYKIPVLLIEFSQDKSFSFLSASDIGDDVTPNSIISKLSLLALHFPRLRIIWSRSLHATAEIFATLKANQDEPDESKAIRVGVPSEDGIVEDDVRAENYNTSAVEVLRRLPGVTDSNYRALMEGCKSLAEVALLPVERLTELMGGHKAARTLREFLDAKYPTLL